MDNNEMLENEYSTQENVKAVNKKKKVIFPASAVLLLGVGVAAVMGVKYNNLVKSYEDKVYPNVYVRDTNVGGMTKEQLSETLGGMLTGVTDTQIAITACDQTFTRTKGELGANVDINNISDQVLAYGKDKGFFEKVSMIKKGKAQKNEPQHVEFNVSYDKELANNFVNEIAEVVNKEAIDGQISISSGGAIDVTPSVNGATLNTEDLLSKIDTAIMDLNTEGQANVPADVATVEPKVTTEALHAVNSKVSTYTTTYSSGPSGYNIEVGVKFIDNVVIMPGEEFSTTAHIGTTGPEKGYVLSNTYVNGQVVKNYGGGVCQISSTLYNTQLRLGIIPTERLFHMMPVTYVSPGLDATIGDESPDLKFVNPYDTPIVINAYAGGGAVTVEMWSRENVTNGLTFKPYSEGGTYYADTYLSTYDANGAHVKTEYIDSSRYMPFN
mgnify:CR=1 FL=1